MLEQLHNELNEYRNMLKTAKHIDEKNFYHGIILKINLEIAEITAKTSNFYCYYDNIE